MFISEKLNSKAENAVFGTVLAMAGFDFIICAFLLLFGGYLRCLDGFMDLLGPSDRYTVASSCEGFNAVVTQTILVLCLCSLVGDYQLRNSANSHQEK